MAIELDNSFTVPVPPEQAWDVLLDVERIAPCMPGASVTSVEGDEIEGQVKVKLGPLSLTYKGTAKFIGKDQANQTITIEATGKETRGAGTASAMWGFEVTGITSLMTFTVPEQCASARVCRSPPRSAPFEMK